MEIRQVRLATRSTDETARFWAGLGCAVDTDAEPDSVRVTVGTTQLVFRALDGMTGAHHLAITIPTGTFAAAKDWVASRTTVLGTPDADEFEGPPDWNSRSVYFEGPDQQLLELIERRDLAPGGGGPAGADTFLLSVSEVGLAVPDVLGAVEVLRRHGLDPYANPPGAEFAPVGDVHGLLILVSPRRRWYPTLDRSPSDAPVVVDIGLGSTLELADGVLLR
ncbi:VOC family protein [Curtobacterium sp. SP.BCo]|uniref:VOC family protein n=1 Tax=Curtobacterium sp. SP.BCo TaxID=3435229 RepID=UPI003F733B1A